MEKPNPGVRLASMLLDHFITCIILMVPMLPMMWTQMQYVKNVVQPINPGMQFAFLGLMLLYFLKDSFNGRSLAKRMLKLQVVDNRTYKPAGVLRCFIRNIFIIFWPLEVLVTFFSRDRRIGDFVAGTRVVNYPLMLNAYQSFEFENQHQVN